MKRMVRDLIQLKDLQHFASATPDTTVHDALTILEETRSSALMIVDHRGLQGIFTERDFARAAIDQGILLSAAVCTVMSSTVYYVEPHFTLEDCLQVMTRVGVRHLPVLEHGILVASVSMKQIVEVLVEDKDTQIQHLTTYISGRLPLHESWYETKPPRLIPIYQLDNSRQAI